MGTVVLQDGYFRGPPLVSVPAAPCFQGSRGGFVTNSSLLFLACFFGRATDCCYTWKSCTYSFESILRYLS